MDASSGVFDNNGGTDYALPLVGAPTEQQVLERRTAAFEAAERERLAVRTLPFCHSLSMHFVQQFMCKDILVWYCIFNQRHDMAWVVIKDMTQRTQYWHFKALQCMSSYQKLWWSGMLGGCIMY